MQKNNLIMKCCVCKRVKTDNGWHYQFVPLETDESVSHGYCPACYRKALAKIEAMVVGNELQLAR